MRAMRTFPLPRPKCSFPFPTCLLFSLPRRESSFSLSRYFRLLRARVLFFSLHTYVCWLKRSWFIVVLELEYTFRDKIMSAWCPDLNDEADKLRGSFEKERSGSMKYKRDCGGIRGWYFRDYWISQSEQTYRLKIKTPIDVYGCWQTSTILSRFCHA